jgi:RND superfamily putative drug exporter
VFLRASAVLAVRHTKAILVTAAIIAAFGAFFGAGAASRYTLVGLEDPSTGSSQANKLIEHATGNEPLPGFIALFPTDAKPEKKTSANSAEPEIEQLTIALKIHRIEKEIKADPQVGEVRSALETGPNFVSRNRALTYITVQFRSDSEHAHVEAAQHLARKLSRLPGVEIGGSDLVTSQANTIIGEDLQRAELLALPLLLLLLLWFFRGLIAAALPLILGGSAIVLTQAGLRIATDFIAISTLVLAIVAALGIGLAIDYSLLIVSRFREELALTPTDVPKALERTVTTAGRTVLFSSLTVTAAFASLLLLPQPFFYSMGIGGTLVTMLVCLAALTILPALLALLGPRVNALAPARLQRSARALARPDLRGRWYRFAQLVMRQPLPVAIGAAALLIAIATSALGARLIMPSMSTMPEFTSVRQVSDALSTKFKLEPDRVTEVVTVGATSHQLRSYRHELASVPGVADTFPPEYLKRHVALMYVSSSYDPSSAAAQKLVERIRTLPTPFEAKVTGFTATFVDLKASLERHLPMAALFITITTLLSIFLLTGSIVLPLKTLLMSTLTASAAVGVLVLVYQHGFLHSITGFTNVGAVEITQSIALVAIVFGISTDYGVFTIDRIREMHSRGSGNREAIALGLERTGRITTTAALLLCVAVGSLITSRILGAQEVSLGITVAVLLDATVVRALLVPALMCMLGELNWWCPAPLRRVHARMWASASSQAPPTD